MVETGKLGDSELNNFLDEYGVPVVEGGNVANDIRFHLSKESRPAIAFVLRSVVPTKEEIEKLVKHARMTAEKWGGTGDSIYYPGANTMLIWKNEEGGWYAKRASWIQTYKAYESFGELLESV